jgi:hypothetical protein
LEIKRKIKINRSTQKNITGDRTKKKKWAIFQYHTSRLGTRNPSLDGLKSRIPFLIERPLLLFKRGP